MDDSSSKTPEVKITRRATVFRADVSEGDYHRLAIEATALSKTEVHDRYGETGKRPVELSYSTTEIKLSTKHARALAAALIEAADAAEAA